MFKKQFIRLIFTLSLLAVVVACGEDGVSPVNTAVPEVATALPETPTAVSEASPAPVNTAESEVVAVEPTAVPTEAPTNTPVPPTPTPEPPTATPDPAANFVAYADESLGQSFKLPPNWTAQPSNGFTVAASDASLLADDAGAIGAGAVAIIFSETNAKLASDFGAAGEDLNSIMSAFLARFLEPGDEIIEGPNTFTLNGQEAITVRFKGTDTDGSVELGTATAVTNGTHTAIGWGATGEESADTNLPLLNTMFNTLAVSATAASETEGEGDVMSSAVSVNATGLDNGWTRYDVPEDKFAMALPQTWRQLDISVAGQSQAYAQLVNEAPYFGQLLSNEQLQAQAAKGVKLYAVNTDGATLAGDIPVPMNVNVVALPGQGVDLPTVMALNVQQVGQIATAERGLSNEIVNLGGRDFGKLAYDSQITGKLISMTQYLTIANDTIYVISFASPPWNDAPATYDEVVATFEAQ